MSGDEVLALIVCVLVAIWGWKQWVGGLLFLNWLSRGFATQNVGWFLPPFAGLFMYYVLETWASQDVRDNSVYIWFYMVMWLAWTGLWNRLLAYLGLSCRDDALERHNTAAGIAIGGGILGVTLIFAGGNIGDGPGWWVVIFCAALATATVVLMWLMANWIAGVSETITVDRDVSSGARTAGFFIGAGVILGRAIAGDWHSTSQTISDFVAKGWPALALWAVAMTIEVMCRPNPRRPAPNRILLGVVPGLLFVLFGLFDMIQQGSW